MNELVDDVSFYIRVAINTMDNRFSSVDNIVDPAQVRGRMMEKVRVPLETIAAIEAIYARKGTAALYDEFLKFAESADWNTEFENVKKAYAHAQMKVSSIVRKEA